jgi:hypothetical protein
MGRVAPTPPTLWPTRLSSASFAAAYAPSGREENLIATRSTHIPSAADALSPPRLRVGRTYTVVHDASLSATDPASAATPPLPGRARHPHRPRLALRSHSLLANTQACCHSLGADSDSSAPRLDASAATSTSAVPLPRYARAPRPTARISAEFHHNSGGHKIAVGFERCQTAPLLPLQQPLFWRRLGTRFFAYHTQKRACPHR